MANIPVEHTKTTPWWLWLLGLLLLAGLIWFLLEAFGDDDEIVETTDPVEAVVPVAALDLSDVWVTRVVGDNTFFVAPTEGGTDETLVYLEEEPTPGDATEGRYDVTPGQHLSIVGSMEPTPADLTPWGLTADQAAMVGDQYVRATSLTILDGDAMADGDMADGDMAEATGLAALRGDLAEMAGRPVQLDGVRVTALAGDSTFYLGDGADRVLVVLESLGESQSGPGTGSDGAFNVDVGDVVNIRGEVKAFQRGMRGSSTLAEADLAAAESRRFVVVVNDRGDFSKQ
ncbi:hypothetical protein [Rubrivirga sp.]|uniref:hypothetical protein n=1 Tax=Rubrivirga sp. TaxID=1885344 RepID=UPI003B52685C